jgi:hypothetical protein
LEKKYEIWTKNSKITKSCMGPYGRSGHALPRVPDGETTAVWGNGKADRKAKQAALTGGQTSASLAAALFLCSLSEWNPWYTSQDRLGLRLKEKIFYQTDGGSVLMATVSYLSHWLPHLSNSSMKELTEDTLAQHLFYFNFIHMCIQCLGHFSPLPLAPPLPPLTPRYLAETILPLSLILLKREYKQ